MSASLWGSNSEFAVLLNIILRDILKIKAVISPPAAQLKVHASIF
jgi:hypothetical protein